MFNLKYNYSHSKIENFLKILKLIFTLIMFYIFWNKYKNMLYSCKQFVIVSN